MILTSSSTLLVAATGAQIMVQDKQTMRSKSSLMVYLILSDH